MTRSNYKPILSVIILSITLLGCGSTNSDNSNNQPDSFESGRIEPGTTFSHTFENEGTLEYYCELHSPDMQGEITITSSASDAERDTVFMEGDQFRPTSLSVAPGTEVIWSNRDAHDHTVVSGNPSTDDGGTGY